MTEQTSSKQILAPKTIWNEIIALILLALGVLLVLCLFSYNADDASLIASAGGSPRNLIGTIGANIAAFLLQSIGLTAYFLPVLSLAAAWKYFRSELLQTSAARIIGVTLFVWAAAAFISLFSLAPVFDASVPVGGLIGRLTADFFASGLGKVGAGVLLCIIGLIGFILAADAPLSYIFGDTSYLMPRLREQFGGNVERFNAWRDEQNRIAAERFEQRRTVRQQVSDIQASTKIQRHETNDKTSAPKKETAETAAAAAPKTPFVENVKTSLRDFVERIQDAASPEVSAAENGTPNDFNENAADSFSKDSKSTDSKSARGFDEIDIKPPIRTKLDDDFEPEIAAKLETTTETADEPLDSSLISSHLLESEDDEEENENFADAAEQSALMAELRSAASPHKPFSANSYDLPSSQYLVPPQPRIQQADEDLLDIAKQLGESCKEFNVTGRVVNICQGPVVTTYEFKPDSGVRYSKVVGLVDDLCLALQAESVRIDRIPGKAYVGIEVPNPNRETITLREVIESKPFKQSDSMLTVALGKTIDGQDYVADLAKMPHLLIAGATGAGKSVGVNTLIVSILYKARPDQVKFIMVDPKQVELGIYADIPHLATPIITDPKRAATSLKWAVSEMERRYKNLARWGVRNLAGYNAEVTRKNAARDFDEDGEEHKPLPYIVIIIDEFADLMMVSKADVEESVTRLAQMARAVGIHLVLATQRPSVDVITGLIKANFPSRISFRVSSKIDSRTIIDGSGAEQLLGRGDMLFLPPGSSRLIRVHGAYVDENEIAKIVSHVKDQCSPDYDSSITQTVEEAEATISGLPAGERDELFEQALRICVEMKRASTSVLQRRLKVGYGRAASILDQMEREGFVGQADGASKPRPVLPRAYEIIQEWEEQNFTG